VDAGFLVEVRYRGVTRGARGHNSPGPESLWGCRITAGKAELLLRASKSPNNVTSSFFNTVRLLPKDFRFQHGDTKLASCPGRHPTSLRLCQVFVWILLFDAQFYTDGLQNLLFPSSNVVISINMDLWVDISSTAAKILIK